MILRRRPEYLHEREPLIRPYEKVLLSLIAFLLAILAVAILAVRATTGGEVAGRPGPDPAERPLDGTPGELVGASGAGPEYHEEVPEGAHNGALLCAPEGRLLFERSAPSETGGAEPLGLAVDAYGRFALYAAANPETGRPTPDSSDLLRGCAPGAAPENRAAVRVEGFYPPGGAGKAGRRTIARETHREEGEPGTLVTLYRFRGGVVLEQRLSLVGAGEGADGPALVVSYRLTNVSGGPRTVGLRSVSVPPPASHSGPDRGPAFVVDGSGVEREREIVGEEAGGILVPRPAVPTDSTGRWRTGVGTPSGAPPPDAFVIAGVDELSGRRFLPRADEEREIPRDAAIGAFWLGQKIEPGGVLTTAHSYGPADHKPGGENKVNGSKTPAGAPDEEGTP